MHCIVCEKNELVDRDGVGLRNEREIPGTGRPGRSIGRRSRAGRPCSCSLQWQRLSLGPNRERRRKRRAHLCRGGSTLTWRCPTRRATWPTAGAARSSRSCSGRSRCRTGRGRPVGRRRSTVPRLISAPAKNVDGGSGRAVAPFSHPGIARSGTKAVFYFRSISISRRGARLSGHLGKQTRGSKRDVWENSPAVRAPPDCRVNRPVRARFSPVRLPFTAGPLALDQSPEVAGPRLSIVQLVERGLRREIA